MKKITLILLTILPFIGISQTLTNTTFDTDVSGWSANSGTISHDAVEGSAAAGSLKLVTTGANGRAQTNPNLAPINGAGDYLITFKVKGTAGTKVQATSFQSGNIITGSQLTLTGGWDLYSATLTGLNTVQMNIRLVAVDPGTYYFDDLTWTFQVPAGNTTLTTNIVGSGTVSKSPDQSTYTPSTTVTLTPLPTTHWSFSNWSGDLTGNANPASVLMDVDKNITANFAIDPSFNFDWLFNVDGNLEGWSIDPQLNVTSHTGGSVTLTPTANQFARFSLFDFPITASTYNKMTITLQNNSATTDQLGIVVGTEVLTYVMSTSDASIQTYEINMTDFASWTGDVTTLRIRFADADNVNGAKPSDNGSIIIDDIILSFDPALSIENNELKQSISLYPNPTTNLLNIDTNENILKSEIYSISGQLIKSQNNKKSIDVSDISSGVYLLKTYTNEEILNFKFIKE